MKKAVCVLLCFLFFTISTPATAYTSKTIFVSAEIGSDNNNGTETSPYKTINKAKNEMSIGDTLIIKGGIYNENIVFFEADGTSDMPYNIKGAEGEAVYISAYEPITAEWTEYKDGIFKAYVGMMEDVAHAVCFTNNKYSPLTEARWPNAPYGDLLNMERAVMDKGSDHYSIYDDELPPGNFVGSTVYLWTGYTYEQYVSYARIVTEYVPEQYMKFDYVGDNSVTYTPMEGDWYYITNSLAALDIANEYYYDSNSGYFYVKTEDGNEPKSGEIQIQKRDNSIELWNSKYINFENINIIGGGVTAHDTDHCTFDNVNVFYSDFFRTNDGYNTHINAYNSTRLCGDYNTWKNSEIAYTMSSGILINGTGNTVTNCDIHDIAIGGGYNAAVSIEGNTYDTIVSHCNLYKSGRFLVYFINTGVYGDGYGKTYIEYNDCYDAMYLTRDGGVIYGYHRNGEGVIIRNNWVHDSNNSCGIYLDNNCSNFIVRNNVVWNVTQAGIVLNTNSTDNLIYRNTVFDCGEGIQGWPKTDGYTQKGTVVANNAVAPYADFIVGANAPTLITNKFGTDFYINSNFIPENDATLIDGGTVISGIEDNYIGSSPDIGAYEVGGDYFIPGTYYNTIAGDANADGRVNLKDVFCIRKRCAGFTVTIDTAASDVDQDGNVNMKDVLLIRKYLVKLEKELSIKTKA